MTTAELLTRAQNGDVLLVKGERGISRWIRILTGESYSHVAVLVWVVVGPIRELFVYEFVEGTGYQVMTLGKWIESRQGQMVFYGVAPDVVREHPDAVAHAAESFRDASRFRRSYGYLSLAKIWVSQLIRRPISVMQKACSTYAQYVWRGARYDNIKRTADPGDIAEHCRALHPLWRNA